MDASLVADYGKLIAKTRDIIVLSQTASLLDWDMQTKMPPRGIEQRSEQLALLAGISHRMATDPETGKLLSRIEQHPAFSSLDDVQKRNVHLIRKGYDEATVLPEELVTAMQRQSALAIEIWRRAKGANDWAAFRPELEKNVDLAKQAAALLMKVKKTETPYDALLDQFEPGMTARRISVLFGELQTGLTALLKQIAAAPRQPDRAVLKIRVPVEQQRKIGDAIAEVLGYDISSPKAGGRIDETEHPFTNGYYDDVRITTHYHENAFTSSIFSILHEAGHALYDQGLNPAWKYQPVGSPCSHGFHESQSRFIENIVGKSGDFWAGFLPTLKKITGETLAGVDVETFVQGINRVTPSPIRLQAAAVTYGPHIIVRFRAESELFAGKVKVADLPEMWNSLYKEYLGIDIHNNTEGVLQDIHWAGGSFGYFPSYALGNIYDGQLLERMERGVPRWREELRKGNITPVRKWLGEHVHSQGDLYDPPDLIKKITGSELRVGPYLEYLQRKFGALYGF